MPIGLVRLRQHFVEPVRENAKEIAAAGVVAGLAAVIGADDESPPFGGGGLSQIVGTRQDLADVFALHAAGRTKVIAEARKLDDVNVCIEEVLAGTVPARLVFTF